MKNNDFQSLNNTDGLLSTQVVNPEYSRVLQYLAFGDAWGKKTELIDYPQAVDLWDKGLLNPPNPLVITDDTQMTLALVDGVINSWGKSIPDIQAAIITEFIQWSLSPLNDRGPGVTCMTALKNLAQDPSQWERSALLSAGCGAVMRVSAAAYVPKEQRMGIAAFSSIITHADPMAVVTSMVYTLLLVDQRKHSVSEAFLPRALRYIDTITDYSDDIFAWLGTSYRHHNFATVHSYLEQGATMLRPFVLKAHENLPEFIKNFDNSDPCAYAGQGYDAMTCLSVSLLIVDAGIVLGKPDLECIRRAVITSGDSDSIASVVGALLGALPRDASLMGVLEDVSYEKIYAQKIMQSLLPITTV